MTRVATPRKYGWIRLVLAVYSLALASSYAAPAQAQNGSDSSTTAPAVSPGAPADSTSPASPDANAASVTSPTSQDANAASSSTSPASQDPNAASSGNTAQPQSSGAPDSAAKLKKDLGQQVFFDGRTTSFNRDMNREVLEGDVVLIGAGTLIGADKITFDRSTGVVAAHGSVVILNKNILFLGDDVSYQLNTSDFVITNASMLANDTGNIDTVTKKVFGFGPAEVAFEAARAERLSEVNQRMVAIQREVARLGAPNDELIDHYVVLLERRTLIEKQENPGLAAVPSDRRDMLKRRRQFWDSSRSGVAAKGIPSFTAYLRLEGDTLTRIDGNDYAAHNALFTPCRCDKDESPAWAFRADEVDAQIGGYADMSNAVLEIKGIPVLYLPYMKMPLKDKRQSGFLMPTTGFQQVTGNTFTQPVFFDLGPNQDITETTDFLQNRGTRLGAEYRIQQRQQDGWNLKLEGIRDSLWMQEIGTREVLGDMYRQGYANYKANVTPELLTPDLTAAEYTRRSLETPAYWQLPLVSSPTAYTQKAFSSGSNSDPVVNQINYYMAIPNNTWRGSTTWSGVSYLAPRLSFVSSGELNSDHRYSEELYLPDSFEQALTGGLATKAFAPAHAQLHLDGRDFYAGIGTFYGDNYLTNQRFEGQQIPADVRVQSRYYRLTPDSAAIPIYAQILGESMQISQATEHDTLLAPPVAGQLPGNLGSGTWRRLQLATVTPLISDSIIQVNQFTEFEERFIQQSAFAPNHSTIASWVTGVEFRLPIDGKGDAPDWLKTTECADAARDKKPLPADCPLPGEPTPNQYVHHTMDWRLRFSARPVAIKHGPYTNATGNNLSYFASDAAEPTPALASVDSDVPDEERLNPSQRITLITDQTWTIQSRGWQRLAGSGSPPSGPEDETMHERARRELMYSLERPVSSATSMYDESSQRWLIDRFQLVSKDRATPMTFHADDAYDLFDAKRREQQKAENAGLPPAQQQTLVEGWKPINAALGMNYLGWGLALSGVYDIYFHAPTTESAFLSSKTYGKTTATVGYTLTKSYQSINNTFQRTTVKSLAVDTGLIPHVKGFIRVSRQVVDTQPTDYTTTYMTAFGINYASPSECWGMQFAREKDYSVLESQANYVLRLSVIFMGQERPLPDMSGAAVQQSNSERTF